MDKPDTVEARLAMRGAFAGAALFIALIVVFSTTDASQPSTAAVLLIGILGATSHLVLLPVVAALPAPGWARAGGYAWIAIDVMLNVASVNGADAGMIAALRLGGHVPAGLWMAMAGLQTGSGVRALGLPLGIVLILHAFASPWVPPWVLFIPFVLIPIWLAIVGGFVSRQVP